MHVLLGRRVASQLLVERSCRAAERRSWSEDRGKLLPVIGVLLELLDAGRKSFLHGLSSLKRMLQNAEVICGRSTCHQNLGHRDPNPTATTKP